MTPDIIQGTGPNYPGHANWTSMVDGAVALAIANADGYVYGPRVFKNIPGTAVDVQSSAGSWQHTGLLQGIRARDCYRGFWLHNVAEYETISDSWADNCVFGFLIESGNNSLSNCKARFNSIGIKIYGGTNDGHGVCSNLLSHHNAYNLVCLNVTNGFSFNACQFIAGQAGTDQGGIQLVNSKGISLTGGQIAYSDISVDATSQLALTGVVLRGTVNFTVATGGTLLCKNNIVMPGAVLTLNGAAFTGNN